MKTCKMMKRLLAAALLAILMLTMGVSALAVTYDETVYVRATGTVSVRTGPDVDYSSYNTLQKGECVQYLGESYNNCGTIWYKVQYYSYGIGWVSSKYSELVWNNRDGVSHPASDRICGTWVQATGGKSNIRSCPYLDSSVLTVIHKGETATYLGQYTVDERGVIWYYVCFNGYRGWLSSRYTTLY